MKYKLEICKAQNKESIYLIYDTYTNTLYTQKGEPVFYNKTHNINNKVELDIGWEKQTEYIISTYKIK